MHTLERLAEQLGIAGIENVPSPNLDWLHDNIDGMVPPGAFALIVPGGSAHRMEKRWPLEHFAHLARLLSSRGTLPVLIGAAAEASVLDEISRLAAGAISLGSRTSLGQIAALARRATCAVGNDTGPIHIAATVGCPTVALFGAGSDPIQYGPRGESVEILRRYAARKTCRWPTSSPPPSGWPPEPDKTERRELPPPALSRGDEHGETRGLNRPRRILAAIFCGFAALLPIVSVVAPKGTVALLLLAAALAVPTYWWAKRRIPVPDLRIAIALALFVAWCAIASAWSVDTARSLGLVLRITLILTAGMVLFPVAAALDEAVRREIGRWLVIGLGLSLAFVAAETGLDYPLLRLFKTAEPGKEAVWFNRGAIAMAMIVWPATAYLWKGRLGLEGPLCSRFARNCFFVSGKCVSDARFRRGCRGRSVGRHSSQGRPDDHHCGNPFGVYRNAFRSSGIAQSRVAPGGLAARIGPSTASRFGTSPSSVSPRNPCSDGASTVPVTWDRCSPHLAIPVATSRPCTPIARRCKSCSNSAPSAPLSRSRFCGSS